jgi:hypothetical protein
VAAGSKENAIYVLSDDDSEDDDVIPLQASQVPEDLRRAPTNRDNPFALDSDDEDEDDTRRDSAPRSSQPGSTSARSNPVFETMQRQKQQMEHRAQRQRILEDLEREVHAKREREYIDQSCQS